MEGVNLRQTSGLALAQVVSPILPDLVVREDVVEKLHRLLFACLRLALDNLVRRLILDLLLAPGWTQEIARLLAVHLSGRHCSLGWARIVEGMGSIP